MSILHLRFPYLFLSVYTLWKHADLLPFLSTPSAVIPVLVNGADLMAPGGLAFSLQQILLVADIF